MISIFPLTFVLLLAPLLFPRAVAAPAEAASFDHKQLRAILFPAPPTIEAFVGLPLAPERLPLPEKKDPKNLGVVVTARSALVLDRKSGAILFSKNADEHQSIASLTKLMTALVALEAAPALERRVTIVKEDIRGGGIEYFIPGERVTVEDLIFASLVGSSNTAAAALARSIGLAPEMFVERMNAKARELGMLSLVFVEPTGLDSGNRGSAADVLRLAQTAFLRPEIKRVAGVERYELIPLETKGTKKRTIYSTDLLLRSILNRDGYKIVAGKTGTLGEESGYHVALLVGADDGREVLVAVLGSTTNAARFADAKALAFWAFDAYRWK